MGKSASEVRSEIEGTRQDMSETIDAIADRTSPGRIIRRRTERMGDRWRSVRERVMGRAEETAGSATGTAQSVAATVSAPNDRKLAPRWEPGPGIVQLVDGRRIRARGLDNPAPPEPPEFGLYLLADPPPVTNWEQRWLVWKNYWLPRRHRESIAALCDAYDRSATERVEVACEAGTGRTGTALACLAVLAGTPIQDAVPYIRYRYDDRAVRARWQRWFVRWFARQAARRRAARA